MPVTHPNARRDEIVTPVAHHHIEPPAPAVSTSRDGARNVLDPDPRTADDLAETMLHRLGTVPSAVRVDERELEDIALANLHDDLRGLIAQRGERPDERTPRLG